ncbi:MAG: UDP-N-acetylglucosamine 1-carboxyvinyltransferase [Alphaproteobacteria bacterium]|nr:UDP-N-acetylglucosamine 1-carboxyvinyltransferase [Alphaproteobacteria bacterium]
MPTDQANTWASVALLSPVPDTPQQVEVDADVLAKASALDALRVVGGNALYGRVTISGAKNAALPLLCAAILTRDPVQFTNVPVGLADIKTLSALLISFGVTVGLRSDGVAILRADNIKSTSASYDLVRKMRASILTLGPILAREGHAEVSLPGGCAIGTRPVDIHLGGFEKMGAKISIENGYIKASAPNGLHGAKVELPFPSVGATENIMMAATLAKGKTTIQNAAREPEIVALANCLNSMGAAISGQGTDTISIQGVEQLHGASFEVIPDRIEAGTFMLAVAMTGGKIILEKADIEPLESLVTLLQEAGVSVEEENGFVVVSRDPAKPLKGTDIMTAPFPEFPTDLQAQYMAMLALCEGAGMVTETVFENRFMHVPELNRMGANIRIQGNSAIVRGVEKLSGANVMATDLRASVALVLAGLVADGETTVNRIYHLDRGYENLVDKFRNLGAEVERVKGQ